MTGRKYDAGKPRWDLIPIAATASMVRVLTIGAVTYADENWRQVKPLRRRYFAAAMRHLWARARGERMDPDSGEPHLAHAMCCVAFLLEDDLQGEVSPWLEKPE